MPVPTASEARHEVLHVVLAQPLPQGDEVVAGEDCGPLGDGGQVVVWGEVAVGDHGDEAVAGANALAAEEETDGGEALRQERADLLQVVGGDGDSVHARPVHRVEARLLDELLGQGLVLAGHDRGR